MSTLSHCCDALRGRTALEPRGRLSREGRMGRQLFFKIDRVQGMERGGFLIALLHLFVGEEMTLRPFSRTRTELPRDQHRPRQT